MAAPNALTAARNTVWRIDSVRALPVRLALEARMQPQILLRTTPNHRFEQRHDARGVGDRILAREILEDISDFNLIKAIRRAPVNSGTTAAPLSLAS